MRVQMLSVLLLFVSLFCAEGIHGMSLAGGSESQPSEEGQGESKEMKREAGRTTKPRSPAWFWFEPGAGPIRKPRRPAILKP
ncbi:unnamed protein product [Eretmochelys imbricata]